MTETIRNWLLEEKNPAIRYRTLADLCECTDKAALTAAYNAI